VSGEVDVRATGLADVLRHDRSRILERCAQRIRSGSLHDGVADTPLVTDLRGFLDRLSAEVAIDVDGASPDGNDVRGGAQDYADGFDVAAVAREWSIVRDVILEAVVERCGTIKVDEYRTLTRVVDEAEQAAIRQHVATTERARLQREAEHAGFLYHDLRNQLTGAIAAVSWWRSNPSVAEEALDTIEASLGEVSRVLERELVRSRLGAVQGGLDLDVQPVMVSDVLEIVEREVRALAAVREVLVEVDVHAERLLLADVRLLRSAVTNLVANAVKFTRPRSTVRVEVDAVGAEVWITVADECGGLGPSGSDVFRPHVQVGADRSGFGLGMAITQQVVEAHRGTVAVTDRPGRGCTFRIALPAADRNAVHEYATSIR
jgi:hypothetical protein